MNGARAIFIKELQSAVKSPLFIGAAFLCSLVWSVAFLRMVIAYMELSQFAQAPGAGAPLNLHTQIVMPYFNWIHFLVLFVIPLLTMNAIAGERKQHTFELLVTSPLRPVEIIVAKIVSTWCLTMGLIAVGALYPLFLGLGKGAIDTGAYLALLLGESLSVVFYVSMGVLFSSFFRSPLLAALLGMVFNMGLYLLLDIRELVQSPLLSRWVGQWEFMNHYFVFMQGQFSWASLLTFVICALAAIHLATVFLESDRWK